MHVNITHWCMHINASTHSGPALVASSLTPLCGSSCCCFTTTRHVLRQRSFVRYVPLMSQIICNFSWHISLSILVMLTVGSYFVFLRSCFTQYDPIFFKHYAPTKMSFTNCFGYPYEWDSSYLGCWVNGITAWM